MSQEKLDHVVSGALYDFMGFLTTGETVLTLSEKHDAAPAADAVKEFLELRGVDTGCTPMIENWPSRCALTGSM